MIPTASRAAGAPAPALPPLSATALLAAWRLSPAPALFSLTPTLAQTLGWADALALSQVLDHAGHDRPPVAADRLAALAWAQAALARLQADLTVAMADPELAAEATTSLAPALAPTLATYRLHLTQQQRHQAARVASLRERLQLRLAQLGGPLARLAQFDAVLARALAEPERQAAAALAAQLWQRAERHLDADPAGGKRRVWQDLQHVLQAELTLRLQPVCGLIEALAAEPAAPE